MAENETLVASPLIVRYRYTWNTGGAVEKVRCTKTGRQDYLFIVDADDVQGGRPVPTSVTAGRRPT